MTDIEALRARMRETDVAGFDFLEVPVSDCLALDAEITRLRDDLDRATRERDEALSRAKIMHGLATIESEQHEDWRTRAEAAEASLASYKEEVERLRGVLTRCRTVLGNMAKENEGAIFYRWPISHEPLRADARHLLPIIDEALTKETPHAER